MNNNNQQLLKDYKIVCSEIEKIITGNTNNLLVRSEDYITPTVNAPTVPLEDKRGYYSYMTSIRHDLERVIIGDTNNISIKNLKNIPNYLKTLLQ